MNKIQLRNTYKTLRQSLSETNIESYSIKIANNLLTLPIWKLSFYHLFLTIEKQKEVDTSFILTLLQGMDKEVIISKSNFTSNTLTHYLLTDNTRIAVNDYGIPEPVNGIEVPAHKIDVVFVPLLAFDELGNRVGYGKGFYDNFLAHCKPNTIKIGLSFFEAESLIEDVHEKDIRLDYCVTPNKIYEFSS
jgi:5-formyltetrahydrofolate cyclo-ligase